MKFISTILPMIAAAFVLSGCGGGSPQYLDPASNDGKVIRVDKIDQQDWANAAQYMINELLESPKIKATGANKVPIFMISKIHNKTSEHIEIDLLVERINIALTNSGKALVTTAVRAGGPEDAATKGIRKDLRDDEEFKSDTVKKKGTMIAPDYSLSGRIIQSDAKAGSTKQSTFTFQLVVTDLETGLAIWRAQKEIIKQGRKRSAVGW